eukprot:6501827-Pyramimonas_sp.AAC.1
MGAARRAWPQQRPAESTAPSGTLMCEESSHERPLGNPPAPWGQMASGTAPGGRAPRAKNKACRTDAERATTSTTVRDYTS